MKYEDRHIDSKSFFVLIENRNVRAGTFVVVDAAGGGGVVAWVR